MPWIQTADLRSDSILTPSENHQIYCGLDNCVTLECQEEFDLSFPEPSIIYDFERALQGPYLEIMQRGFLVDDISRRKVAGELRSRIAALQGALNEFSSAIWSAPLNSRSNKQLKEFFYDRLRLPEQFATSKGVRRISCNRESLEKLDTYLYARPFISCILAIRDLAKQLEVFETEIDSDGRYRTSYNIAGTETGRPSSSSNAFGTGGNAQNIAPSLRYVFIADPGYKLVQIDLEQVEARDVGFFCGCLFNKWDFLDACESGDLHTSNARRVWRELDWPSHLKFARVFADRIYYRDFTYRDMAKRLGHLSHYMGSAWTAARTLKIPQRIAEDFQSRYITGPEAAYPEIAQFWQWIAERLQLTSTLTTPFGRTRQFFGRPGDDSTLREAIAFLPQSTTADRMNLGLWRVWKYMPQIRLLAQTYDSITFQYSEDLDEEDVISEALGHIRVELSAPNGRVYVVPGEAKVGWNWGYQITPEDQNRAKKEGKKIPRLNLGGLAKWTPGRRDLRSRPGNGFNRVMED